MDGESGSRTGRGDLSILATFCNEDRKTPLPKEILGTQTSGDGTKSLHLLLTTGFIQIPKGVVIEGTRQGSKQCLQGRGTKING